MEKIDITKMSISEIVEFNKKCEQILRERIRNEMSILLCEYDEDDEYGCDIFIEDEDYYGNSITSLCIVGMWQEVGDIYFRLDTGEIKCWYDFSTDELLTIANDIDLF